MLRSIAILQGTCGRNKKSNIHVTVETVPSYLRRTTEKYRKGCLVSLVLSALRFLLVKVLLKKFLKTFVVPVINRFPEDDVRHGRPDSGTSRRGGDGGLWEHDEPEAREVVGVLSDN